MGFDEGRSVGSAVGLGVGSDVGAAIGLAGRTNCTSEIHTRNRNTFNSSIPLPAFNEQESAHREIQRPISYNHLSKTLIQVSGAMFLSLSRNPSAFLLFSGEIYEKPV